MHFHSCHNCLKSQQSQLDAFKNAGVTAIFDTFVKEPGLPAGPLLHAVLVSAFDK